MARITKRCRMFESDKYWEELDITTFQFFKVMIGDFRKQLRIPAKFVMNFRERLSESIKLVCPSGHVWTVKLVETAEDTLLQTGWRKFVQDHCLEFGDFLIFKYNGNSSFHITIFDKSGCEREGSYFIKKHNSSCSDDRCALEDRKKVPDEIIDVNSSQISMKNEPFRNRRPGCSTKSAKNELKRPVKTKNQKSPEANLSDAKEEVDSSEDRENSEESLRGDEECLLKERNKRKSTFDPAYQAGGSTRRKNSRADGQKNKSSGKPRRHMRYSYVPIWE